MAEVVSSVPASVLAIYAHPDDPDVAAGGTLAAWAAAGSDVQVCICADGDKGGSIDLEEPAPDLVARRRREATRAGEVVGVSAQHWLGYLDGEIEDDIDLRKGLVSLIRRLRPEAVVAHDPTAVYFGQSYVNHRDHRILGWAALEAVYPASSNPRYFPDSGPAHRVAAMYLSGTLEPDVWVDVTSTIDAKANALACHVSQVGEAGEWLREAVRRRAEEAGRIAGVPFAEAYKRLVFD